MISVCNNNARLEEIQQVEVRRPERAGRVWRGISHKLLTETIIADMLRRNWSIKAMAFSLSKDQADLAGAFDIEIPNLDAPEGQMFSLGFLTSNMMRKPLKFVVGTKIFVCNNGMATGEIILKRKHTFRFNLSFEVTDALNQYGERARLINHTVEQMKERSLPATEYERLLVKTGRDKILPWSRIGQLDEEYQHPTFADHNERTSWGLYNAFTHIVKKSPPMGQMDQMNKFRALLPLPKTVNSN